jgi:hypothetical protein
MELAAASAEQTKQVLALREGHAEEAAALKARAAELEAASDDGLIIGRHNQLRNNNRRPRLAWTDEPKF